MDDLVQVLLLVLTLVIFVFSAIRKQKKKPASGTSSTDDLLESIFGIPQPTQMFVPVEEEIELVRSQEITTKPTANSLPEEGIVAIQKNPMLINPDVEGLETPLPPIDLRTAVIHSEILTRKYF